jgi:predicted ATPase
MLERNLVRVWNQLRGAKAQHKDFLERVRIRGLRGITDLSVPFSYPVSVLAGPNACGKSTVLFVAACAYKVPGAGVKDYAPGSIFPRFKAKDSPQQDTKLDTALEYSYLSGGEPVFMKWALGKTGWSRSYGGAKKRSQPSRKVYLRTLANLSNPSEVRSYLQMDRQKLTVEALDASLLSFAQRILPFKYNQIIVFSRGKRDLLFATRTARATAPQAPQTDLFPVPPQPPPDLAYSEFHMSAGERSVLRLSSVLSKLQGALVLIDEVETGLHPLIQQQLMYELQQLALRNQLQIVVTTHSPAVLETVPEEGRIFLERPYDSENVERKAPYRDIIQRAMYGVSRNKLSVLCEDEVAEGVALGIFDYLIGRDTGKEEFPTYLKALARFDLLGAFVFLLDGDARNLEPELAAAAQTVGKPMPAPTVLFLPGDSAPEKWIWQCLQDHVAEYADEFSVPCDALDSELQRLASLYESTSDRESNKLKERFYTLCNDFLRREKGMVARVVGKKEAQRGELYAVTQSLEDAVREWRSQQS